MGWWFIMHLYNYNTEREDIRQLLLDLWQVDSLENLHEVKEHSLFTMESNSDTSFHKKFYSKLREGWPEFMKVYQAIVKTPSWMSHKYLYQTTPTLRIHFVNNWATPESIETLKRVTIILPMKRIGSFLSPLAMEITLCGWKANQISEIFIL